LKERYMFGFFQTIDAAKRAEKELKEKGFEVYVDRFSPIGGGNHHDTEDEGVANPFTKQRLSLAEATLGSPQLNDDERILRSAHPDASGLSATHPHSSLEDVSVTVFAPPERYEEAWNILVKHGARK
jgi:hypothetical protein